MKFYIITGLLLAVGALFYFKQGALAVAVGSRPPPLPAPADPTTPRGQSRMDQVNEYIDKTSTSVLIKAGVPSGVAAVAGKYNPVSLQVKAGQAVYNTVSSWF